MSDIFQNQELQFPLSYNLKVIYNQAELEEEHARELRKILVNLGIPHQSGTSRRSGEGRYVSISTPVEIADRDVYDALYTKLKDCSSIKCAI